MKIGYFADGAWSHNALNKLIIDETISVEFVVPRFESQDPVLRKICQANDIDFLPVKDVNDPSSISMINAYGVDLMASMSFDQILKSDLISTPPLGFINCHAGKLPFYRGRNVLNWVLINDESEFGVTVHYIDNGIDTGDIIIQRVEPIADDDCYATLLSRAVKICGTILFEAIKQIESGKVTRTPQNSIHPVGFYCCKRVDGDEWVNWNNSSRKIFNFVRAISEPGPYARTSLNKNLVLIKKVIQIPMAPNYVGKPGQIVGFDGHDIIVKTGDSTIKIVDYEFECNGSAISIGNIFENDHFSKTI